MHACNVSPLSPPFHLIIIPVKPLYKHKYHDINDL